MTTDDSNFLTRWSRRKQAVREEEAQAEPNQPAVPADSAEPPAEAAPPGEEAPVSEDAAYADVDYEALDYTSDYTRFMGKDVPEMVQRRALRALWRSDPVLANIDGLNDYDEDFTDAALVVENLASAYKPGRGYASEDDPAAQEADESESKEEPQVAEAGSPESAAEAPAHADALEPLGEEPIQSEETAASETDPATLDEGGGSRA